jgi:hypothetical protein
MPAAVTPWAKRPRTGPALPARAAPGRPHPWDQQKHSLEEVAHGVRWHGFRVAYLRSRTARGSAGPSGKWGEETLVSVDRAEGGDVVDRLLWRDAQVMLGQHAEPDAGGHCVGCGQSWPCVPRRIAERAELAASKPWNEAWTVRHDMHSLRTTPGWRADLRGGHLRRGNRNRGLFD